MNREGQVSARKTGAADDELGTKYHVLHESISQSVSYSSSTESLHILEPPNGESIVAYNCVNTANDVRDLDGKIGVKCMIQEGKKDIVKLASYMRKRSELHYP